MGPRAVQLGVQLTLYHHPLTDTHQRIYRVTIRQSQTVNNHLPTHQQIGNTVIQPKTTSDSPTNSGHYFSPKQTRYTERHSRHHCFTERKTHYRHLQTQGATDTPC